MLTPSLVRVYLTSDMILTNAQRNQVTEPEIERREEAVVYHLSLAFRKRQPDLL
jgi:hypothetical protein